MILMDTVLDGFTLTEANANGSQNTIIDNNTCY